MIEFDNSIDEQIARTLLAGGSPTACGCVGCSDLTQEGLCPCGRRCRCLCTLVHRREQRREWEERIRLVRMKLRKAGELPVASG